MDYHSIHGHDVASFDLPSTHRLPTVTAADALDHLDSGESRFVSTGHDLLDGLLAGGIATGQLTEIWGPPGSGKTALGLRLSVETLGQGQGVVWVDCFHPVNTTRLVKDQDAMKRFSHYTCPSLPHLIALLCRPTASCIPPDTRLVVVDSLSALVNHAFPKGPEPKPVLHANGQRDQSASGRRQQVLQYMVGAFQKLAATRHVAVTVLSQCATRVQGGHGAALMPAINATAWEQGISTRLVLFRDWVADGDGYRALHLAGVQKLNGKAKAASTEHVAAFDVGTDGLIPLALDTGHPAQEPKSWHAGAEIADSDDGDDDDNYGWREEDQNDLPDMPSQWQGSEDLLLTRQDDSEDGEEQTEVEIGNGSEVDGDDETPHAPRDGAEHVADRPGPNHDNTA